MPSIRRLRRRLPGRSLHHQRNPRCESKRPLDVREGRDRGKFFWPSLAAQAWAYPALRMLLGAVTTDPLINILLAAGLTWAAHSSVTVVLLVMAFAAQAVVPPHAAFALVLGANLGTAINPLLESGVGGDPAAKRLPIGNLINRIVGWALALG